MAQFQVKVHVGQFYLEIPPDMEYTGLGIIKRIVDDLQSLTTLMTKGIIEITIQKMEGR